MKIIKCTLIILTCFCGITALAQNKNEDTEMTQLLELSRPAAMHKILLQLAGTWHFQDAKLVFVKGELVRTSQYDNRFFKVEMTGGKLPLPVEGGMKEDNYREFQLEGYDNVRKKFVTISVNNHIGSDIQEQTGTYDAANKKLTYEWESEILPNKKVLNRRIITIVDANHYTEEYYEYNNAAYEKVRELDYSR